MCAYKSRMYSTYTVSPYTTGNSALVVTLNWTHAVSVFHNIWWKHELGKLLGLESVSYVIRQQGQTD